VIHRFAQYELDEERRALRVDGDEVVLQPLIFDLLAYLLRNRQRVVSKEKLLDALWPGVVVTERSLQRAVSLARSALRSGGAATFIRTYPRQGYRFCDDESAAGGTLETVPDAQAAIAREHFERGEWTQAADAFQAADRQERLNAEDLERSPLKVARLRLWVST